MPDITFSCPRCGQDLDAPEDCAGQLVECPGCGADIKVPRKPRATTNDGVDDDDGNEEDAEDTADIPVEEGVCPECGAEMEPDSVLCLGCGYHVRLGRKIHTDLDADGVDER